MFTKQMSVRNMEDIPSFVQSTMGETVKVFRINPEFRILRLTFHRKSASKC